MLTPDKPPNEAARVAALHSLNLLDTAPEERFDRLTRLARRLFDVPMATVSLVDANRQWFKSCMGMAIHETSRDVSFCGHTILGDDLLVVPDALADPRFSDNPLVTAAPNVRFYAGCPLALGPGIRIGTLCIADIKPRSLDSDELALLHDLGRMAEQELVALQLATTDELTGLSNRRGFEVLASYALRVCKRMNSRASLLFLDLDDFKRINDTYGHAEGDRAIMAFAGLLRRALRQTDVIGRLGGDEFVALLVDTSEEVEARIVERLREEVAAYNTGGAGSAIDAGSARRYELRYSVGHAVYDPAENPPIGKLLEHADEAMYAHKRASACKSG
ncbi:sensor domain-containing diguanylate cyclase [Trinickia caryophylli]|uniref:Diguanylate cyclase with GAF sensor n=1 Tax=Trinickia caryophylli TaxID=28094 RepID=A0A1X7EC68_TRICW|nr:sensor domain-containing diguanylate cyclase [Trinickia caryophylli]PMS12915.1 sensor domain-containing diguanylate cyclase [Trinickia caryophylli]TRX14673.1 sensor domain-containing diguanylate cyclase [Trinickia caryophylli]WQE14516.1 sensor domain-containing diguanylate cyclase [Trinickia caryophylli]SMF31449.1 diguanylate cyclase with GAF sensor [Trinickia caryophylli]GLU32077.1 GGDEF domain-containing protein [Trinickia caryophylli]